MPAIWIRLEMGIVVFLAGALTAIDDTPAKRTLVEYRHVGDDALSQPLTIEVETAFEHLPDFTPSSGTFAWLHP